MRAGWITDRHYGCEEPIKTTKFRGKEVHPAKCGLVVSAERGDPAGVTLTDIGSLAADPTFAAKGGQFVIPAMIGIVAAALW